MRSDFSTRITRLRREKGLSQKEVAKYLGVSQSLLSHYENGIRECGLDFLIRISDYYGVSCDYLLGCTENRDGLPNYSERDMEGDLKEGSVSDEALINSFHALAKNMNDSKNHQNSDFSDFMVLSIYRMAVMSKHLSDSDMFKINPSVTSTFSKGMLDYYESRISDNLSERKVYLDYCDRNALNAVIGNAERKILESMEEVMKSVG